MQETARCSVMDVVHKAAAAIRARAEQEKEQEDVAQSHVDVSVAPVTPVTLEDIETPMAVEPQAEPSSAPFTKAADEAGEVMVSPVPGDYQQEAGRAVVSPAQHEEEVLAAVTMIPGAESGISYLAPGADDEGEAAASPLSQGSQPQEEPAAFPEENDEEAKQELECVSDKELSQGEALTMYNICVAHRQPEEAPQGSPSQASSHHGITLPRVPYLERFQPVAIQQAQRLPSPPSKIKPSEQPKRICLVRAPEKEEHQARLTPMPPAWASNNAVQKEAAPQRQRHGPALQNIKVPDALVQVTTTFEKMKLLHLPVAMVQRTNKKQETARCSVMDVVHKAAAAIRARAEQEKEQEDVAQSHVDVSVAPVTPVTLEDIETPMAVEPQAEPSSAPFTKAADEAGEVMVSPVPGDYQQEAGRAVVSPAQHEEEVLAAVTMIPGAESGISYLAPGADDEGEAAASPLSQGSQPQEEPAAFPEENDEEAKQELECVSDKELSQGEALTMYNICVAHRQPEEAPQGSPSQASSHHGITLPRVPYLERFQPVAIQQAQQDQAFGAAEEDLPGQSS
ncbi:flocculation protein FLO11-like [Melopsittacus undulatus]|uniref:flocculation protein FLO11-like n=1 Tax=Melopsittacus undulatus TaxID=13146 RepID=UPI001469D940|nr:flocculation protein FLO11-like [Melopsittacus undulatus]